MKRTKVLLIKSGRTEEYETLLCVLREAGFELAQESPRARPDVVLLDLPRSAQKLEGMLARASSAGAPLIVMSRDSASLPRRARALGAYGWIPKPVASAQLTDQLRSAADACRRQPTLFGARRER